MVHSHSFFFLLSMLNVSSAIVMESITSGLAPDLPVAVPPAYCMTHLCIDFGSSGAKFRDCSNPALVKGFPDDDQKFFEGSNAFARMLYAPEAVFNDELSKFTAPVNLQTRRGCPKVLIRKCGGTAGNRFQELATKDEAGWYRFNEALKQTFAFSDEECQTFEGTKEAQLEWLLTDQADMFVGIGGASMQLRLVTDKECPDLKRGVHFQGGKGASEPTDYCWRADAQSQLWSFLSDFDIKASDAGELHLVGGGDQTLQKLTNMLAFDGEGVLKSDYLGRSNSEFLKVILDTTVRKDPMWMTMLGVQHPAGCMALPNQITVLSNAVRKASFDDLVADPPSLLQITDVADKSSSDAFRTSFLTFVSVFASCANDPVCAAGKAKEQCKKATNEKFSPVDAWWNDSKASRHEGFDCVAWLYHLAWVTTLAGLKADDTVTPCFTQNMQRLLDNRKEVKGDWMAGAMKAFIS